jgi:hypothetical protein
VQRRRRAGVNPPLGRCVGVSTPLSLPSKGLWRVSVNPAFCQNHSSLSLIERLNNNVTNRQSRCTRFQGFHRLVGAHHFRRRRSSSIQVLWQLRFRRCYHRRWSVDHALDCCIVSPLLPLRNAAYTLVWFFSSSCESPSSYRSWWTPSCMASSSF